MQNFIKIHLFILFILKILLSGNEIMTSFKGHNSVLNLWILTLNNPKLDVVNINAYVKFGQNPSKFSQDTEWKRKCYGRTDRQMDNLKTVYSPPLYFLRGCYNETWQY